MKRKIPLMLVLGIVGVLVVSFIIDSRTSAGWPQYDVEVCDGESCEAIGYVVLPPMDYLTNYIMDTWSSEDITWEDVDETEDLMNYTDALVSAVESDPYMGYALGVLDDLPGQTTFFPGFGLTDLVPDYAHYTVTCSVAEDQTSCGANYRVGTIPGGREVVVFIDWSQSGYGDSGHMRYDPSTGEITFF